MTARCPWKIHFGVSQDATVQCDRDEHESHRIIYGIHKGLASNGITEVEWMPGDRREYTGDWPGQCMIFSGCTLHAGHHGSCAP